VMCRACRTARVVQWVYVTTSLAPEMRNLCVVSEMQMRCECERVASPRWENFCTPGNCSCEEYGIVDHCRRSEERCRSGDAAEALDTPEGAAALSRSSYAEYGGARTRRSGTDFQAVTSLSDGVEGHLGCLFATTTAWTLDGPNDVMMVGETTGRCQSASRPAATSCRLAFGFSTAKRLCLANLAPMHGC